MVFFAGVLISWLLAALLCLGFGLPLLLAIAIGAVGGTIAIFALMFVFDLSVEGDKMKPHGDQAARETGMFRE